MYSDKSHVRKHRFNLSTNDEQRQLFIEEAERMQKQPTATILELALECLAWRRHAEDSSKVRNGLRRANA
ncbi:hypothetical protein [Variovorax boronicumulans]|uniref:hypothetical protein n=1 Tax=Variovorax boronicumulans TaxID=436515 RepID=UPI0033955750